MTTATPRRPLSSLLDLPPIRDVRLPAWAQRVPRRVSAAAFLLVLVAVSAYLRTRTLGGELWSNEATATGIASHPLSALPGVLRRGGSAPLYYVLLHGWIDAFGSSASATHTLSLVFALLTIPVALWTGWSLFGRRAGLFAAVLFAFSSFLTQYAQETQVYGLMCLLGLLGTAGFLHGFVYRHRRWLWLFAASLALMLYTQGSAILFWFGAAVALVPLYTAAGSGDRRRIRRDAAIAFAAAAIAYLPWLPTTIFQIAHTTAPWHYTPLIGAAVPSDVLGGQRVAAALLVPALVTVVSLLARGRRATPDAATLWALITMAVAGFALARVGTLVAPSWATRHFAPVVAPLLLFGALTCARGRTVGVAGIVLCVAFLANPSSFAPAYKSDMQDVAGELGPRLHPGDLVLAGQPDQLPLAWYYLPGGVRFASTIGAVRDPTYMNWIDAREHLQDAGPLATFRSVVATLKPGQQLLYLRPLTEGAQNWKAPWTQLVRRRSAQWGAILTGDVAAGTLEPVAVAPHNYRGACCVADSAVLYRKTS